MTYILSLKWDVTTIDPDLKTFTYCMTVKQKQELWKSNHNLNAMHSGKSDEF